jgi:ubiquinone/menaquinone biosynthesis C-methylase UbiE
MSTSSDPLEEQPEGYFVRTQPEESVVRQMLEGKILLSALGGVWPEQTDTTGYRRVLDVGCGIGYWLVHAAKAYPAVQELYGVDISPHLIARARQLAREQHVNRRVEFQVMDALSMLEFPFDYLDLVNIQMGGYFLRTWEWPKLLQESRRVTRQDGVIRAVEMGLACESNSPAFNRLIQMFVQALYQAGYYFSSEGNSLQREIPRLFTQFGVRNVQSRLYPFLLGAQTPEWQRYSRYIPRLVTPWLSKWGRLPDDYSDLCQRVLEETARPDFLAHWSLLVVWGKK